MIAREEAERLRSTLLAVLAEDAYNARKLIERLDSITQESGVGAHAALLLILTGLAFDEQEARQHWQKILEHGSNMQKALGRDPGVRVSLLDYFTHVNRQLTQPTLIELRMVEASDEGSSPDRLTGLIAEVDFRRSLQTELRRARRYGQCVAVVLFDFDDFAAVNDRFGTLVGDRLLREAAIVLNNNIRDIDVASRPAEDEFALLLPETDRNGALLVAERFRRELETFFGRRESRGQPVGLTISGGVACYPGDATEPELLLERAAQALYRAKATGKNGIALFQPERRRYLRFELEPGKFEVEVLAPAGPRAARPRNLSRNGILFDSPERLEVGERIEIRLAENEREEGPGNLCIRGQVVRLEELPASPAPETPEAESAVADRFEVGVAFDLDWNDGDDDLLRFLERARTLRPGRVP